MTKRGPRFPRVREKRFTPFLYLALVLLLFPPTSLSPVTLDIPTYAFSVFPSNEEFPVSAAFTAIPLPIGLLSTIPYAVDISRYSTGAQPEPEANIGHLAMVLQHPGLLILGGLQSSERIALEVSADSISIVGWNDTFLPNPILENEYRTPIHPGAFTALLGRHSGNWHIELGYAISATPYVLSGNDSLIDVLEGSPLGIDLSYELTVHSEIDMSVAGRLGWQWQRPTTKGSLSAVVSLLFPLSIAHVSSTLITAIETDHAGLPVASEADAQLRYWHLSNGLGIGVRSDLAIVYNYNLLTLSLSLFNVMSGQISWGTEYSLAGSAVSAEKWKPSAYAGVVPTPVFTVYVHGRDVPTSAAAIHIGMSPIGGLLLGGTLSVASGPAAAEKSPVFSCGIEYDSGLAWEIAIGQYRKKRYVEAGFRWEQQSGVEPYLLGVFVSTSPSRSRFS